MRNTFSKDKNLYDILAVSRDASKDEIKKSYRKLAMKYHPDRNPNNPQAEEKFKDVQHAYDVLYDDYQRLQYNEFLDELSAENSYTNTNFDTTTNNNSYTNSTSSNNDNNYNYDYYQQQQQQYQQQRYQYYQQQRSTSHKQKKGFFSYLIAILFPFMSFFLIGRPLAGIFCLFFQTATADLGHIIAAIWAVNSVRKYNNQLDYF